MDFVCPFYMLSVYSPAFFDGEMKSRFTGPSKFILILFLDDEMFLTQ